MKLLFSTLLCHRDAEIFKFNWFAMRYHLDHGFDLPHLILNDGSLTDEDKASLKELPQVFIEDITPYDIPVKRTIVLSKLDGFKIGFEKYEAKRVIIMDSDIFFYRNWDADLRKICTANAICLRDWGSSLGPNVDQYRKLFGVHEDHTTPNSNTGICSVPKENYHKLPPKLKLHIENPFNIMHDQGVFFASYYGEIEYVNGVKCFINNGEHIPEYLEWMLKQNACHLMGMRARKPALQFFLDHQKKHLGDMNLSQFTPIRKHIPWGLLEHETYNYKARFQFFASTYQGKYITDAMYMHAGSAVEYHLPPFFDRFKTKIVIMDTGIQNNDLDIRINGEMFRVGDSIDIPVKGKLTIETQAAPGGHLAFLSPTLKLKNISLPKLQD